MSEFSSGYCFFASSTLVSSGAGETAASNPGLYPFSAPAAMFAMKCRDSIRNTPVRGNTRDRLAGSQNSFDLSGGAE